ncbi:MAG: hypothetical protein LBP30_01670 [Clostridiales Family XIII bacterium]|jgi:hypothetical protein|nr:hypothetical protein [Clostridiales Family XIII bacterium]
MAGYTAETYIEKKDALLTKCLRLTEDIYSGVGGDPEALPGLLDLRMETIKELETLDADAGAAKDACPEEAANAFDSKLRLILSLDERIEGAVRGAQRELLGSIRSNMMERKFTGYSAAMDSDKGRYLNEKQ